MAPSWLRALCWSLAVAPLAGCGGIGSFCTDKAECEGGNEADQEACELNLAQLEDRASVRECPDDFEAYLECLEDNATCEDERYTTEGACDEQRNELLGECLQ